MSLHRVFALNIVHMKDLTLQYLAYLIRKVQVNLEPPATGEHHRMTYKRLIIKNVLSNSLLVISGVPCILCSCKLPLFVCLVHLVGENYAHWQTPLRRLGIVFILPRLVLQILFQIQFGLSYQCEIYQT